jgi:hypothetical protein
MGVSIDIPDSDVRFLNPAAQQQLKTHVNEYVDQLLAESSRIEADQHTAAGDPEISSSMIKDAAHLIKRGYQRHKKSGWHVTLDIAGAVSALLVGLMFDFDRLKDPQMLVGFLVLLAIALGLNIVTNMRD